MGIGKTRAIVRKVTAPFLVGRPQEFVSASGSGRFAKFPVLVENEAMTIHAEHPFASADRDLGRQLRSRLGTRVALVTSGEGRGRVGLTVTSLMVAGGERWRVLVLLDPDSDLAEALDEGAGAVVQLLAGPHRYLADAFAGLAPAPGGVFTLGEWEQAPHGPRLVDADTWVGCRVESRRSLGWADEVVLAIEDGAAGDASEPLHHLRGAYRTL